MSNDFQQTVNLREEMDRQRLKERAASQPPPKPKPQPKKEAQPARKKFIKRSRGIDDVYNDKLEETTRKELHKITMPLIKSSKEAFYRQLVLVLGAIVVLLVIYFMFFSGNKPNEIVNETNENIWYAVILTNGNIYYGQVDDTTTDPVVIKNVYYDYAQINKNAANEEKDSGNLKLVKQGSAGETYDPDTSLELVRTNVQEFKKLKEDSKVLRAILENEEKYK